jgi:adenylate kinase family enzyme
MARKNQDQEVVRRYLLEPLAASEKESIEHRVLSDKAFSEELEIVEDELIEEYLADELSRADRKNFEEYFLAQPDRCEKLEGGRVLKRYVDNVPSKPSIVEYLWRWVKQSLFSRRMR